MLLLSKLRRNWLNLPSISALRTASPVFLYLFSKGKFVSSDIFNIFSADSPNARGIGDRVRSSGIPCYSSDIADLPPKLLDELEVTTLPVVLGVLNGRKVGEVHSRNFDALPSLCDKLKAFSAVVESELVLNLRELIERGDLDQLRRHLSHVRTNFVREIEVDRDLFNLVSKATIIYQDNPKVGLDASLEDLGKLNLILKDLESFALSGSVIGAAFPDHSKELKSLKDKYDVADRSVKDKDEYKPGFTNDTRLNSDLRAAYLLKINVLRLVAVKYFRQNDVPQSLSHSLESYKLNVSTFNRDLRTLAEFESCGSRQVLESLFALLDPIDPLLLQARAEVENVLGKRLLNPVPTSTRPKGGVTKKRRGFGNRYIWQGMEYRPKKYKPRDLREHLNEWQCTHDSNLPSFN